MSPEYMGGGGGWSCWWWPELLVVAGVSGGWSGYNNVQGLKL